MSQSMVRMGWVCTRCDWSLQYATGEVSQTKDQKWKDRSAVGANIRRGHLQIDEGILQGFLGECSFVEP